MSYVNKCLHVESKFRKQMQVIPFFHHPSYQAISEVETVHEVLQ